MSAFYQHNTTQIMKKISKLLCLSHDEIMRDIPAIKGLLNNFKQEYIKVMQPHILAFLKARKYVLYPDGKNEPKLECVYKDRGYMIYHYSEPEVRVLCKRLNERDIVKYLKYEHKAIE